MTRGLPFEVTSGVANHSAGGGEFAISRNGTLVYFSPGVGGDEGGRLVLMNRRGEREPAMLPDAHFVHPRFSPDGTSLAGERDFSIWTIDLLRGTSTRVATGARMGWPVWSADGKRIFYASERSGPWQIWSRAADGSDEERQILKTGDYSATPFAVSPDGKELLVHADHKNIGTDIEIMDGSGTGRSLVRSDADDNSGTYSGRAVDRVLVGRVGPERSVRTTAERSLRPLADLESGRHRAALGAGRRDCVPQRNEDHDRSGEDVITPRLLLDANASDFDLARDGRVLIVEALDPAAAPGRLNVVVNWFEEIRRR